MCAAGLCWLVTKGNKDLSDDLFWLLQLPSDMEKHVKNKIMKLSIKITLDLPFFFFFLSVMQSIY